VGTIRPEGSLNFFERVVEHLRTTYPHWDRSGGADHIFTVTPKMGVCDPHVGGVLRQRPRALTHAIVLTHFGRLTTSPPHMPRENGLTQTLQTLQDPILLLALLSRLFQPKRLARNLEAEGALAFVSMFAGPELVIAIC
jgi:hypothetical protein